MKANAFEMTLLFDYYGDVLTDKQRDFFDLYHNEDLSLSEIAENTGISRQGVRDIVYRAECSLRGMEERLGLIAKNERTRDEVVKIRAAARSVSAINNNYYNNSEISGLISQIENLCDKICE